MVELVPLFFCYVGYLNLNSRAIFYIHSISWVGSICLFLFCLNSYIASMFFYHPCSPIATDYILMDGSSVPSGMGNGTKLPRTSHVSICKRQIIEIITLITSFYCFILFL